MEGNSARLMDYQAPATGGALAAAIAALGPWFHNLHLPDGSQTAPHHPLGDFPANQWAQLAPHLPEDLTGRDVLDIGCNAGFYALALARRGAQVVGLEPDPHFLRQAEWAAARCGVSDRLELLPWQVYRLPELDREFDLVLFLGVFYHLRYPLLALDLVAAKVRGRLVFQTLTMPGDEIYRQPVDVDLADRGRLREPGWPAMAFVEHRLAGDPTNWWVANRAGVEAMLRSAGMRPIAQPAGEMYLCVPDREPRAQAVDGAAEQFALIAERLRLNQPGA